MFGTVFQLGYVTADLDAGIAALSAQFAVSDFRVISDPKGSMVFTPQGKDLLVARVAVARVGAMAIEVIQPIDGPVQFYRDYIKPGEPVALQHLGIRSDDIDTACAHSEQQGSPKVIWGTSRQGVHFAYMDTRATLGHYLEYIQTPTPASTQGEL